MNRNSVKLVTITKKFVDWLFHCYGCGLLVYTVYLYYLRILPVVFCLYLNIAFSDISDSSCRIVFKVKHLSSHEVPFAGFCMHFYGCNIARQ